MGRGHHPERRPQADRRAQGHQQTAPGRQPGIQPAPASGITSANGSAASSVSRRPRAVPNRRAIRGARAAPTRLPMAPHIRPAATDPFRHLTPTGGGQGRRRV
ncbi:hypothetical protein GCM10010468_57650 [Actinocorallia longicatena]|uniref:Uncharacterized protein n=1 Tax=Actinocorallia longicatena TaxID=111803 RepID=A0ABP6QJ52_9ACTN